MSADPSAPGLVVAVIGATGAVGRDLLATLPKASLPIAELRLFASPRSAGEVIDVEDKGHRVQVLAPEPGASPGLEGVQLAFLAVPPAVAREVGPALAAQGILVVDVGGALGDLAPMVVPAIGVPSLGEAARERMVSTPSGPGVVVASVLGALRDLSPSAVRGTVLLSAGMAGREGVEELSAQVVALFNHKEPPRRIFPRGLAFDLLPEVGAPEGRAADVRAADARAADARAAEAGSAEGPAGWTPAERRLAAEVALLTELPERRVALTLAVAPLFSGIAANLHVELEAEASLDEVRARLEGGRGVRWSDPLPGPRRLVGRAGLYLGGLRADPAGQGVHLWAIADNLRFAATGNAIALATHLWREGLL